ncbi:MAG: electron transfer flavoprotein subunit beta/FixA family protein [Dehalococcoidia bacterium]|nr:electron transfer flavoprotein subunit beta/FixA family protein [Dehalococcoidia bacterium]
MNIIVCVKQIPDPETPASSFKVDEAAKKVIPAQGIAPVVNPYDPQATEAALRLNEADGGGKVTVISLGPDSARDAIKHALAMGADEGVLLTDSAFDDIDNFQTAAALAAAIQKLGGADLVLMGRAAADWDMGVVPSGVAQILGVPCVTLAKAIEKSGSALKVERVLDDGFQTVEVNTPAVVSISNEFGEPRYPQLRQIMLAAKRPSRSGVPPTSASPAKWAPPTASSRSTHSMSRRSKATSRSSKAIRPKRRPATSPRSCAPRSSFSTPRSTEWLESSSSQKHRRAPSPPSPPSSLAPPASSRVKAPAT